MWSLYLSLDIELIRSALGQLAKWILFDCLELFTAESQSHPIQECPNSTWWAEQIDNSPMSTNIMPLSSSCYVSVACCLFWERVWFLWMGYPHRIQLYMWMLPRTSPSGVGMSQNWWLSQHPFQTFCYRFPIFWETNIMWHPTGWEVWYCVFQGIGGVLFIGYLISFLPKNYISLEQWGSFRNLCLGWEGGSNMWCKDWTAACCEARLFLVYKPCVAILGIK